MFPRSLSLFCLIATVCALASATPLPSPQLGELKAALAPSDKPELSIGRFDKRSDVAKGDKQSLIDDQDALAELLDGILTPGRPYDPNDPVNAHMSGRGKGFKRDLRESQNEVVEPADAPPTPDDAERDLPVCSGMSRGKPLQTRECLSPTENNGKSARDSQTKEGAAGGIDYLLKEAAPSDSRMKMAYRGKGI